MPIKGVNIHVMRGFSVFFFNLNNLNTKLSLSFNKNKVAYKGVFIIPVWFYCKYHVGSIYMYINCYLYSKIANTCWAPASGRSSPSPFRLMGQYSMRLATPGTLAMRVSQGNRQRSSEKGFFSSFPLSLLPS